VQNFEGTGERIELRALHLRTYDNRLVLIPNSDVFTSVVTSNTASPYRRRDLVVAVDYGDDLRKALQVALEAVRGTPGVMEDPAPDALIDELGASTIALRLRFYTHSLRADYLKVGSDCLVRVKRAFEEAGLSMPGGPEEIILKNSSDAPVHPGKQSGAAVYGMVRESVDRSSAA